MMNRTITVVIIILFSQQVRIEVNLTLSSKVLYALVSPNMIWCSKYGLLWNFNDKKDDRCWYNHFVVNFTISNSRFRNLPLMLFGIAYENNVTSWFYIYAWFARPTINHKLIKASSKFLISWHSFFFIKFNNYINKGVD